MNAIDRIAPRLPVEIVPAEVHPGVIEFENNNNLYLQLMDLGLGRALFDARATYAQDIHFYDSRVATTSVGKFWSDAVSDFGEMTRSKALWYLVCARDRQADANLIVGELHGVLLDPNKGVASVGVWLAPEYRGVGNMTSALLNFAAYAASTNEIDRVRPAIDVRNAPSQRLAARFGAQRTQQRPTMRSASPQTERVWEYAL